MIRITWRQGLIEPKYLRLTACVRGFDVGFFEGPKDQTLRFKHKVYCRLWHVKKKELIPLDQDMDYKGKWGTETSVKVCEKVTRRFRKV